MLKYGIVPRSGWNSKPLREVREYLADILDVLNRQVNTDLLIFKDVQPKVVDVNVYLVHRTKLRSSKA
jgi:hypothetical protein